MHDRDGGQEADGERALLEGGDLDVQRDEHVLTEDDAVARREAQHDGLDGHQRRRQEPRALVHEFQVDLCAAAAGQHAAEFHGHGEAAGGDGGADGPDCEREADAAGGCVDGSGGGEDAGADDAGDGEHVGGGPREVAAEGGGLG